MVNFFVILLVELVLIIIFGLNWFVISVVLSVVFILLIFDFKSIIFLLVILLM